MKMAIAKFLMISLLVTSYSNMNKNTVRNSINERLVVGLGEEICTPFCSDGGETGNPSLLVQKISLQMR